MTDHLNAFLIAGEASGDQLGAHLIDGLRSELDGALDVAGIGGAMMEEAGLSSLFPMTDLSIMGIGEVLPRLPHLFRRLAETTDAIVAAKPDVLITIDSPDFTLRVARQARKVLPDLKIVHYVAPSVWAWRPGRAKKLAKAVDHVLALLPFEPPYMEDAGMTCDFVGHPVTDMPEISAEEAKAFRQSHGIPGDAPLLTLLPGSRPGELARHGPVFRDALDILVRRVPGLAVVLPAAHSIAASVIDYSTSLPLPVTVLDPRGQASLSSTREKLAAFRASQAALAVSGTVSLELATQNTPMVIGWDASPSTRFLLRRLYRPDTANLVNLVADTYAVPEFMFENFSPDRLASAVGRLVARPDLAAPQRAAAAEAMRRLGRGGEPAGLRAARSVLRAIR